MKIQELELDELLDVDPEPCPSCPGGIRWMLCYDGEWRCRNCVWEYLKARGWDKETVASPETEISALKSMKPLAMGIQNEPSLPFQDDGAILDAT